MAQLAPDVVDAHLHGLLSQFKRQGKPIPVVFRDLVSTVAAASRATHAIHPYPARLLLSIPRFFLAASELSAPGDTVLDPFCGSGTVLLEAILAGRNAYGADANPLARLISRVKTRPIDPQRATGAIRWLRDTQAASKQDAFPDVLNRDYWFSPRIQRGLLGILQRIEKIKLTEIRELLLATFSSTLRDLSFADPRLSVPVRLKPDKYAANHRLRAAAEQRLASLVKVDVLAFFLKRLETNARLLSRLREHRPLGSLLGLDHDARQLTELRSDSIKLTITSPPYLGAQKYVRASSLSLTWLSEATSTTLRHLEDKSIGREHYPKASHQSLQKTGVPDADALLRTVWPSNPLRAHIASTYLLEMKMALKELARVTAPRGHAVLVVGPSSLCGHEFPTPDYLTGIAEGVGFETRLHLIDPIRSRSLLTKRASSAGRIDSESVIILRKAQRR